MKKVSTSILIVLGLFLIAPLSSHAQKKQKANALDDYEHIFGRNDPDFEITEVPEEFVNESAVILSEKNYLHYNFLTYINLKGLTRKRVKILDKSAIEDFSEFYFKEDMKTFIKIEKPDGTTQKVKVDNAVKVTKNVPKIFRIEYSNKQYLKVAVPNLEEGDIIDFIQEFDLGILYHRLYLEYTNILSSDFPLVKSATYMDVRKMLKFRFRAYNGAPDFKLLEEKGLNTRGKRSKEFRRYELKFDSIEKLKGIRWGNAYIYAPYYKLQITFENKRTLDHMQNAQDIIYKGYVNNDIIKGHFKAFKKYYNYKGINDDEPQEVVDRIYNSLRYYFMVLVSKNKKEGHIPYDFYSLSRDHDIMPSTLFLTLFRKALSKAGIEASPSVAHVGYYRNMDQSFFRHEVLLGLYIDSLDKYYWPIDHFCFPGEMNFTFQNGRILSVPFKERKKRDFRPFEDKINETPYDMNLYETQLTISIDEDNKMDYGLIYKFNGIFKARYAPLFLKNTDFVVEIAKHFKKGKKLDFFRLYNAIRENGKHESKEKVLDRYKEHEKEKEESLLAFYKDEYNATKLNRYDYLNSGILTREDTLIVTANFEVEDQVKKAGPNLLIPLEQLIGEQLELDKEDLEERREDAYLQYGKKILNTISISIPDGYSVKNLEDLNTSIDNDVASFSCTATVVNGHLKLNTSKLYKMAIVPKEQFTDLTDMVTAAYAFSRKNVVLAKK